MMKLEPQTARVTMYLDRTRIGRNSMNGVNLAVKIDGKLYEIEAVVSPIEFGPITADDFCNITASFGGYDLETVEEVKNETDTTTAN